MLSDISNINDHSDLIYITTAVILIDLKFMLSVFFAVCLRSYVNI